MVPATGSVGSVEWNVPLIDPALGSEALTVAVAPAATDMPVTVWSRKPSAEKVKTYEPAGSPSRV